MYRDDLPLNDEALQIGKKHKRVHDELNALNHQWKNASPVARGTLITEATDAVDDLIACSVDMLCALATICGENDFRRNMAARHDRGEAYSRRGCTCGKPKGAPAPTDPSLSTQPPQPTRWTPAPSPPPAAPSTGTQAPN